MEKVFSPGFDSNTFYALLIGCYGYRLPHDLLSTDIDTVFEHVIPCFYSEKKGDGPYAGSNIRRDLLQAICHGQRTFVKDFFKEIFIILNGKEEFPSPEYSHYMFLRFHLKLMEMLQKGVEPYTELELDRVMANLEKKCSAFLENHAPALWNGKQVCEDIGAYTGEALEKLSYFKQFAK